jgi:aconitate hydratase
VLSIEKLDKFTAGNPLFLKVAKKSGEFENLELNHSFSSDHINWFKAGSALNLMKSLSEGPLRSSSKIASCSTRFNSK